MVKAYAWLLSCFVLLCSGSALARNDKPLANFKRVVFVGDSITYAGQYIEYLETILRLRDPDLKCEFINVGLPSETVSSLSEPGHAGGQFPRPDLHERLQRVLDATRPDLVVACYGMNDGIYSPFSRERFQKYQVGIDQLRAKVSATGAKLIHLTPPVFDPNPIRSRTLPAGLAEYRQPYVGYDEVLALYSAWLLAERGNRWEVVDLHQPMLQALERGRKRDPSFRFANDGVHANSDGHWLMACQILKHWNATSQEIDQAATAEEAIGRYPQGKEILALVQKKQRLTKDAWLSATGHKRPGMNKGLDRAEAERQANELESVIRQKLSLKK